MNELYEPEAYFDRTEALFLQPSFDVGINNKKYWLATPSLLPLEVGYFVKGIGLFIRLMTLVREAGLRRPQAAVAVSQGPPASWARPLLRVPYVHALSCPVHGKADGQPRDAARQFVLNEGRSSEAIARIDR